MPVAYEYRELVQQLIEEKRSGKIFFFNAEGKLDDAEGTVSELSDEKEGMFINLDAGQKLRLDRVITIFGKPGPAYDEYDAYGNVCLDCRGGYDL